MDLSAADYRELARQVAIIQAKSSTSSFFFDGADRLRLRTFGALGSVVIAVEGRLLDPAGNLLPFAFSHTPNSDRTVATSTFDLGEGFLLNVALRASSGSPRIGQVWAILDVVRGLGTIQTPVAVLWQGYLTDTTPAGWPGVSLRASIDGPGVIRSILGTNPAAGIEMAETVPTNARWRLLATTIVLVTDVTVANRQPTFSVTDGTTTLAAWTGTGVQAASLSRVHVSAISGPLMVAVLSFLFHPQPAKLMLMGGFQFLTNTVNLQAGDNYAAPQLLVEEWIED